MLDERRPVHLPRSLSMLVMVRAVKQRHIPNPSPTPNPNPSPVWHVSRPESANLVYCIECSICSRLYIGQTKNSLLQRLKQHLYSIDKTGKATYLYEHFRQHGSENLCIMGLESGS